MVLPLSLCSCFLLFTPGNMLCIADVLLVFLHTLCTSSCLYYKSQRARVFLLSKKHEFRLNYFPSFPAGNSHLINRFPAFRVYVRKLIKRLHFFHDICMLLCLLLCLLVWKYHSPFPPLVSTGALYSRVQVQGECI